jgi:hypothetical protein
MPPIPDWTDDTAGLMDGVRRRCRAFRQTIAACACGAVLAGLLSGDLASAQSDITIIGTMIAGGVECHAMRAEDGTIYTMRRSPLVRQLRPGARVKVEGKIAETSTCQQGITIVPTRIEQLP